MTFDMVGYAETIDQAYELAQLFDNTEVGIPLDYEIQKITGDANDGLFNFRVSMSIYRAVPFRSIKEKVDAMKWRYHINKR